MRIRTVATWQAILARPDLLLVASLIVLSLLLFVAGVALERSSGAGQEAHEVPCVQQHEGSGQAGGEGGEAHPAVACAPRAGEAERETVLGVNFEDPRLIGAIVVGWLALIGAIYFLGRLALQLVVVAGGAQLIFDAAEVARQIGLGHGGIAAIAALVAVSHAAVVAMAVLVLLGRARPLMEALQPLATRLTIMAQRRR
jgi:hypothetical protein